MPSVLISKYRLPNNVLTEYLKTEFPNDAIDVTVSQAMEIYSLLSGER